VLEMRLVAMGFDTEATSDARAAVGTAAAGRFDLALVDLRMDPMDGISLMEQGIKKGNLRRPDDAKLRLGEAQIYAGKKSAGVQTLRDVKGTDGTADMARLWILNARA